MSSPDIQDGSYLSNSRTERSEEETFCKYYQDKDDIEAEKKAPERRAESMTSSLRKGKNEKPKAEESTWKEYDNLKQDYERIRNEVVQLMGKVTQLGENARKREPTNTSLQRKISSLKDDCISLQQGISEEKRLPYKVFNWWPFTEKGKNEKPKAEGSTLKEYENLKEDYKLVKNEERRLDGKVTQLRADIRKRKDTITSLERKISLLEDDNRSLQQRMSEEMKLQNKKLTNQKAEYEDNLARKCRAKDTLETEKDEEIDILKTRYEKKIQDVTEQKERLKKQLEEEKETLAKKKAETYNNIQHLQKREEEMAQEAEGWRNKFHRLDNEWNATTAENDRLARLIEEQKEKIEQLVDEKHLLKRQLDDYDAQLGETRNATEVMKSEHNERIREMQEETGRQRESKLQNMERLLFERDEKIAELEKRLKQERGRHQQALIQERKHYEGRMEFMRKDMEEEKKTMEREYESMLRTGESILKRREREVQALLDAQQTQ